MAPPEILRHLKTVTHAAHERVDALVPIRDPRLTLAGYGGILARMLAVYAPLEDALAAVTGWPVAPFSFEPRRKVPLLHRDLEVLAARGVLPSAEAPPPLPALDSIDAALGVLYVLEGATLGGQVVLREVAPRLGLPAGEGTAFYNSYGADVGPMWKAFTALAEACAARPDADPAAAAQAALGTFDAIASCFSGSRAPRADA